jgi:hypothetical protein
MTKWRVYGLIDGALHHTTVRAENRSKAITRGARILDCHRDMIVTCENLNPLSGGGSKRG